MTLQHQTHREVLELALKHTKPFDPLEGDVDHWLNCVGRMSDCFLAYLDTPGQTTMGFHHGAKD